MVEALNIKVHKTENSRIHQLDQDNIQFARLYSDHMFQAEFKGGEWRNPEILPYKHMEFSPASQALHYGVSVFEGMKAYKNQQGDPVLFRPLDNFHRLNRSSKRLCIPEVPEEIFMEGMSRLLQLDSDWIPDRSGTSLYVRPFTYCSEEFIGIRISDEFKFMIITTPVGKYYSQPVKVKIETEFVRAAEGGTGYAKAAGNYAGALYPTKLAMDEGYQQLIWTDAKEHKYIEEAGTMNLMFVIDGKVITPELTDTLLAGITRDSILTLSRDMGYPTEERKITVDEVVSALKEGRMQDAFGVGTAATVAPISVIGHEGTDYTLPDVSQRNISASLAKRLQDIKEGRVEDKFGWIYRV